MLKRRSTKLAEDISAGKFRDGSVAVTPDNSVVWDRHRLPGNLGDLLLAPDCGPLVVKRMAQLALGHDRLPGKMRGAFARVRLTGGVALKDFREPGAPHHYGMDALRLNVSLSEGLSRIDNVVGDWRLVAPRYLAGLFRPDNSRPGAWAMSDEPGKHPLRGENWDRGLPPRDVRKGIYARALQACGVSPDPKVVAFDEKAANTLVRPGATTSFELVKLDLHLYKPVPPQGDRIADEPLSFVAVG